MNLHLKLGGLMGASPYSNFSILDASTLQMRYKQDQRYNLQQQFPTPHRQQEAVAPPVIKFVIPDNIIQDVMCRFIVNIPDEEKFDPVRALFQIELAHWFFIDHYCGEEGDPSVSNMGHIPFSQFAYIMFQATPHLLAYYPQVDKYLAEFRAYRSRVPTFGAILMNQQLTQVVLVQGFRNQWGFPKGKVNEIEDPVECAIREVFEETGYDMRPLINANHYIESKTRERNDRLYLVRGVDVNFPFYPQTQYEIKKISWFDIDELPEHKKDTNPKILNKGHPITNFFTIYPYIKRLKLWVGDKLEGRNKIECFRSRWFDSDKEEEENCMQYPYQIGDSAGMINNYSVNPTQNVKHVKSMRSGTPGQEIMRSVQGGLPNASLRDKENPSSSEKKGSAKGTKSRRRLFTDVPNTDNRNVNDRNVIAANIISDAIGIPFNNMALRNVPQKQSTTPKKQTNTTTKTISSKNHLLDNYNLSAPSWENFKLDQSRILRALRGETL